MPLNLGHGHLRLTGAGGCNIVSRRESVETKGGRKRTVVAVEVTLRLIRAFPSRADTEARSLLECEQTAPRSPA